MALAITSFMQFLIHLEHLKGKRRLFAFILYDERPSSRVIGEYFLKNIDWLNSLANASKMYVFVYREIKEKTSSNETELVITKNPSLKIAHMFGIKAKQLPGIVFFTLPEFKEGNGIHFPLDPRLFTDDQFHAEELISAIFSVVQKCQFKSRTEEALFDTVSADIGKLLVSEKIRPMGKYLNRNLQAIGNIPISFFDKAGEVLVGAGWGMLVKGAGL